MDNDRKTVLKLTILSLCDELSNEQIEAVIAWAEDLLDAPHICTQAEAHSR